MLKRIIKEQLLLERKIAELRDLVTITYVLKHDVSGHSQQRKFRHVKEGGEVIYDSEIVALMEKVKKDITYNIVVDQIQDDVRFIVSDNKYPYLNIIVAPKRKTPYEWILTVISVMNKPNFAIGRGQLRITP